MRFNATTAAFELQYQVGSVDPELASEIFVLPERYPGGAVVMAVASSGNVTVEYDESDQWVRVRAAGGLQVGATVTVHVTRKGEH